MTAGQRHRLDRLARNHHGVVTRGQLADLGLSSDAIDHAIRTGRLIRLFRGVYRVVGAPMTWHARALAAQLRVATQLQRRADDAQAPPLVVLGGEAAAHLHALPGHDRPPRLTVTTSRRCRSTAVPVERRVGLSAMDVATVERVPVTSLAWTVIELAARAGRGIDHDVVAHVLGIGALDPAALLGPAYRTIELPGRGRLVRELTGVTGSVDHTRSRTESRFVEAWEATGLPAPRRNCTVRLSDDRSFELDVCWLDQRLDVELDGPHHLLPTQRRRDRIRDRALRGDGFEVVRIPVEEFDEDAAGVIDRVACVWRRRAT